MVTESVREVEDEIVMVTESVRELEDEIVMVTEITDSPQEDPDQGEMPLYSGAPERGH